MSAAADRKRDVPAHNPVPPLLAELVTNTLDGGYAAAARRRGGDHRPRRFDRPLVALGALLAGFLLVIGYVHANRGAPRAAKVHDALVNRVRSAESAAADLDRRVTMLQSRAARERDAALPQGGALAGQLSADQLRAGQVAVHGPGVQITLREPKSVKPTDVAGRGGSVPITATHILSDRDVRSVVNELWHDGAEAIAVNGVRLTPASAIRFAGEAVLVDFQPIASPYEIAAIGNPDQLATAFAQSPVASRYQTRKSALGIGFSFSEHDDLKLAAGAPAATRRAVPAATPSPRSTR